MEIDPLDIALQNIIETRNLLQGLITSSESFNYPMAKEALRRLQRKTKELMELEAQFSRLRSYRKPNIQIVDFARPRLDASLDHPGL